MEKTEESDYTELDFNKGRFSKTFKVPIAKNWKVEVNLWIPELPYFGRSQKLQLKFSQKNQELRLAFDSADECMIFLDEVKRIVGNNYDQLNGVLNQARLEEREYLKLRTKAKKQAMKNNPDAYSRIEHAIEGLNKDL